MSLKTGDNDEVFALLFVTCFGLMAVLLVMVMHLDNRVCVLEEKASIAVYATPTCTATITPTFTRTPTVTKTPTQALPPERY